MSFILKSFMGFLLLIGTAHSFEAIIKGKDEVTGFLSAPASYLTYSRGHKDFSLKGLVKTHDSILEYLNGLYNQARISAGVAIEQIVVTRKEKDLYLLTFTYSDGSEGLDVIRMNEK